MQFLFLVLVGVLSGIFAGMGMGGGTFLVPLLSLLFGVEQIICQSTNVICFVVLAAHLPELSLLPIKMNNVPKLLLVLIMIRMQLQAMLQTIQTHCILQKTFVHWNFLL